MGRLDADQRSALAAKPDDLSGDLLDKLLQEEFKVTAFQCLVAKARALNLSPFNVAHYRVTPQTFERIRRSLPGKPRAAGRPGRRHAAGRVRQSFEVTLPTKIQEMTGKPVIRLLAREKDIKDKFNKGQNQAAGFDDVVLQIGADTARRRGGHQGRRCQRGIRPDHPAREIASSRTRISRALPTSMSSPRKRKSSSATASTRVPREAAAAEEGRPGAGRAPEDHVQPGYLGARLPQDGRIVFKQYTKKNLDLDLRVSTAPLNHGEGVVMRILDKQKSTLPLPALVSPRKIFPLPRVHPPALRDILHCGPTGSGKSMTLYSALNEINTPDIVIRTAETRSNTRCPA